MDLVSKFSEAFSKLSDKFENWIDHAVLMLPNFVIAVLIVAGFGLFASFSKKYFIKGFDRVSDNEALNKLMASITSMLILIIGLFIALGVMNLDKTVTSLLAGVGVVGIAIGFAFQDSAANFISGIVMAMKYPMDVGDIVETNGFFGKVRKVSTRYTLLDIPQGQLVVLPNKNVLESSLKNYTITGERRIDLECGISYGDDLEKVKKISLEAIKSIESINHEKPVEFFFTEFGDSSINFIVRYWIEYGRQPDFLEARSEGVMRLKKAFNENDITIPFPIRTLDFGIKGGEKLGEVIPAGMMNGNPESKGKT